MNKFACGEAIGLFGMTLKVMASMSEPDDELRCELLISLGDAESKGGSRDEANRALHRAAEVARNLGSSGLFAQAAATIANNLPYHFYHGGAKP